MTKKLLAALLAIAVMLTACVFASAAGETAPESNTDVTVSITLDGNGATSGAMDPVTVNSEGKATLPANTYERNNYKFDSWNTNPDGSGTKYAAGAEITVTESITLYAQWVHKNAGELVYYDVTYDANGGEGETVDIFSPYLENNDATVVYNEFTRDGYTFKEWNTKADGTGTAYQPDETFEIKADTVLYAIWENNNPTPPPVVDPSTPPVDNGDDEPNGSETPKGPEAPATPETPDSSVTDTDANPGTGDAAATAVALGAAVVALGAFVVLKKKD